MLNITKTVEPDEVLRFKRASRPQSWNDFTLEIKHTITEHILQNEQKIGSKSYCVYCERKIKSYQTHIEHIKPKNVFPNLFDKYENLVVSCQSNQSCGHAKGNNYNDKFINPVEEDPENFMTYEFSTGEIIPVDNTDQALKERVEYTCDILRLNQCRELVQARKTILVQLFQSADRGISFIDYYDEFLSLINCYKRCFI
jgi:uncharacterized protein (TIGR02646 family)